MEGREEGGEGEGEREGAQETSCVVLPGEEAEVRINNQSIHVHCTCTLYMYMYTLICIARFVYTCCFCIGSVEQASVGPEALLVCGTCTIPPRASWVQPDCGDSVEL